MKRHCSLGSDTAEGGLSVEAALVFPVLFLLWCALLSCLFSLYARGLAESICSSALDIGRRDSFQTEQWTADAQAEAERILRYNGIGAQLNHISLRYEDRIFYHDAAVELVLSHHIWGNHYYGTQRREFRVDGAYSRNLINLLCEIGDSIPGIQDGMKQYKEMMRHAETAISGKS